MGGLSSTPLPPPFSYVTGLSGIDVEEVLRRFRVSPPKSMFAAEKVASTSMNASNLYLTTMLAGVVSNILSESTGKDDGVDVQAIIMKFLVNKMEYVTTEKDGQIARVKEMGNEKRINLTPQATINVLPFLAGLIMFSSAEDDTRSKLSRLIDCFQFNKATAVQITKDTVTLIIVCLFRAILVMMKDDEMDGGMSGVNSNGQFNVGHVTASVQKLFEGEDECTDAHGNTTKKAVIDKGKVLDWACGLVESAPGSIERPSTVFNLFAPTRAENN